MRIKLLIAFTCGFLITSLGMHHLKSTEQKSNFSEMFKDLKSISSIVEMPKAFALQDARLDRLILIKSLYFFVNGGADGTWPSGENGELTGYNAPSDRLKGGFLGVVNDILGPNGDVIGFLKDQGYTSCASLPDTSTDFNVTDDKAGELTVNVSKSERDIPAGLVNTGKFEKRILISEVASETPLAAIHLHCSTSTITMLVRIDTDLEVEGEVEAIEAIMEGTESGNDVHLQFITQNAKSEGRDLALKFITTNGEDYSIYVAFTSGAADANGNGPAHILAGVVGKYGSNKATLHVMGGNADLTGSSVSNDVANLPFDKTQTVDQMAAGNQFCVDTTTAGDASDCATLEAPGTPAISGLPAWTLEGIYAVRQGTSNVGAITSY